MPYWGAHRRRAETELEEFIYRDITTAESNNSSLTGSFLSATSTNSKWNDGSRHGKTK
jgi:hypothetical protein